MNVPERYERQQRIPGWDQGKLTDARVVIIGSGLLAYSVGLGLVSAGVGSIYFMDDAISDNNELWFPKIDHHPGEYCANALVDTLVNINPLVKLQALSFQLSYEALGQVIPSCSILINTTNDIRSKQICIASGRKKHNPVILASAGRFGGCYQLFSCVVEDQINFDEETLFQGEIQSAIPAMVIGGAVVMEALQFLQGLPRETSGQRIKYNYTARERFVERIPTPNLPVINLAKHRLLLVGAGALGNFVLITLAQLSDQFRVTIVDPDMIEEHNRNRQPGFFGLRAVGKPKARVLAQQIKRLNPKIKATAQIRPVLEEDVAHSDLVFLCVDSFAVRAEVNQWAVEHQVPMINGGTSAFMGEVEVYQPGVTGCLNDYLDILTLVEEEKDRRARCGYTPEASVVATNQLVGGLMVGEMGSIFSPLEYGSPLSCILAYEAQAFDRFGIRSQRQVCQCHLRSGNGNDF